MTGTEGQPAGLRAAHEHLRAAMAALGVEPVAEGQAEADRATARKVNRVMPGVPAGQALAVIKALRAIGWAETAKSDVSTND